MNKITNMFLFFLVLINWSCQSDDTLDVKDKLQEAGMAVVENVRVSGSQGSYTLAVTLKSPDTGCDQYADWWEVISDSEELIYRRILAHSHVNEQPFTRSGGTIDILNTQMVIIRGHMNNTGYSKTAFRGSVKDGFELFITTPEFGASLENIAPLPKDCAF